MGSILGSPDFGKLPYIHIYIYRCICICIYACTSAICYVVTLARQANTILALSEHAEERQVFVMMLLLLMLSQSTPATKVISGEAADALSFGRPKLVSFEIFQATSTFSSCAIYFGHPNFLAGPAISSKKQNMMMSEDFLMITYWFLVGNQGILLLPLYYLANEFPNSPLRTFKISVHAGSWEDLGSRVEISLSTEACQH